MPTIKRAVMGGVAATLAMTVVFIAGRTVDRRAVPPPATLLASAMDRLGIGGEWSRSPRFEMTWLVLHFSYGCLIAPLGYAFTRRLLPEHDTLAGVAFSEADWVVDYVLLWPLLGLYPKPHEDTWPRSIVNVLGHAVYGAVLGRTAGIARR